MRGHARRKALATATTIYTYRQVHDNPAGLGWAATTQSKRRNRRFWRAVRRFYSQFANCQRGINYASAAYLRAL